MITLKHFIFNELEVNAFVLHDESGACLIVDPGCKNPVQQQNLKRYITENNLHPECIVLTHGHFDHVAGIAWAKNEFSCPILMHRDDLFLLKDSVQHAALFGIKVEAPSLARSLPGGGDHLTLGTTDISILHVPGHSPGNSPLPLSLSGEGSGMKILVVHQYYLHARAARRLALQRAGAALERGGPSGDRGRRRRSTTRPGRRPSGTGAGGSTQEQDGAGDGLALPRARRATARATSGACGPSSASRSRRRRRRSALRAADVVIATSPPLVAAIPGWLVGAAAARRSRSIFEMRDLWPESAVTTGVLREGSLLTAAPLPARAVGLPGGGPDQRADAGLPRRPGAPRAGAPTRRSSSSPTARTSSGSSPARATTALRRELGWGDRFVVMYSGAHGRANAVGQLRRRGRAAAGSPGHPDRLRRRRAGAGRLEERRGARGLDNIRLPRAAAQGAHARLRERLRRGRRGAAEQPDLPHGLPEQGLRLHGLREARRCSAIDGVAREYPHQPMLPGPTRQGRDESTRSPSVTLTTTASFG